MKNYFKLYILILFVGILVFNYGYILRNNINTFREDSINLNAKPMEIFLADCGNYAIEYETMNYNTQKPIAFINWLITDAIGP